MHCRLDVRWPKVAWSKHAGPVVETAAVAAGLAGLLMLAVVLGLLAALVF